MSKVGGIDRTSLIHDNTERSRHHEANIANHARGTDIELRLEMVISIYFILPVVPKGILLKPLASTELKGGVMIGAELEDSGRANDTFRLSQGFIDKLQEDFLH